MRKSVSPKKTLESVVFKKLLGRTKNKCDAIYNLCWIINIFCKGQIPVDFEVTKVILCYILHDVKMSEWDVVARLYVNMKLSIISIVVPHKYIHMRKIMVFVAYLICRLAGDIVWFYYKICSYFICPLVLEETRALIRALGKLCALWSL